jgi:hypothetical protein
VRPSNFYGTALIWIILIAMRVDLSVNSLAVPHAQPDEHAERAAELVLCAVKRGLAVAE